MLRQAPFPTRRRDVEQWSFRALDEAVESGYRAAAPGIERIKQGLMVETRNGRIWR